MSSDGESIPADPAESAPSPPPASSPEESLTDEQPEKTDTASPNKEDELSAMNMSTTMDATQAPFFTTQQVSTQQEESPNKSPSFPMQQEEEDEEQEGTTPKSAQEDDPEEENDNNNNINGDDAGQKLPTKQKKYRGRKRSHRRRLYDKLFQDVISIEIPVGCTADLGIAIRHTRQKRIAELEQAFPHLKKRAAALAVAAEDLTAASEEEDGVVDEDDATGGKSNNNTDNSGGEKKDTSAGTTPPPRKKPKKNPHALERSNYSSMVDYLEAKYVKGVMIGDGIGGHDMDGEDDEEDDGQGSVYSDTSFLDDEDLKRDVAGQVLAVTTTTKMELEHDDSEFFVNVGNLEVEETELTQKSYDPLKDIDADAAKKAAGRKKPGPKPGTKRTQPPPGVERKKPGPKPKPKGEVEAAAAAAGTTPSEPKERKKPGPKPKPKGGEEAAAATAAETALSEPKERKKPGPKPKPKGEDASKDSALPSKKPKSPKTQEGAEESTSTPSGPAVLPPSPQDSASTPAKKKPKTGGSCTDEYPIPPPPPGVKSKPEIKKLLKVEAERKAATDHAYKLTVAMIKTMSDDDLPKRKSKDKVTVTVPADRKPGDSIFFNNPHVVGQRLKVKIPKNAVPGGTFKVTVPAPKTDGDENEDEDHNTWNRDFYDQLSDFAQCWDQWMDAIQERMTAAGQEAFPSHLEKRKKFDKLMHEFPNSQLKTPVDKAYLQKILRRARQNKHKRDKTAKRLEEMAQRMGGALPSDVSASKTTALPSHNKTTRRVVPLPAFTKVFPQVSFAENDFA